MTDMERKKRKSKITRAANYLNGLRFAQSEGKLKGKPEDIQRRLSKAVKRLQKLQADYTTESRYA